MADLARRSDLCAHFTNVTFVFPDRDAVNLFDVRGFSCHGQRHLVFEKPLVRVLRDEIVARSAFLVRRDVLLKAGPFDPRLSAADDRDLLMRVALRGPWGCCSDCLVKYCRRPDGLVTLSRRFQDNEKYLHECNIYVYDKLLSDPQLTPTDRREIVRFLSGRLFDLGLCQRREGDTEGAARSFRRSVQSNPNIKNIVKYALTLMPPRIAGRFLQRFESHRSSGFRA
jgi:GT2 family glycosyltransferase